MLRRGREGSLPNGESLIETRSKHALLVQFIGHQDKNCRAFVTNTQYGVGKVNEEIVELQSRLAFQEDLLQELNGTLARQQQEIRELRLELEVVRRELRNLSTAAGPSPEQEPPPPHY